MMMSMTTRWSMSMTPIAAITLTVNSAEAQYIESSTWDSSYGQYGAGPQTCAQLRFQGSDGDYRTGGGSGQLSSISYRPAPDGGTFVHGRWSFSGSQGWLSFTVVRDGSRFEGCWGFGPPGGSACGSWNGTRASVSAAATASVPARGPRSGRSR
jgi:hypothetical protein